MAALQGNEPKRHNRERLAKRALEHLDRVRVAVGDVDPGVSTETAADSHRQRHGVRAASLPRPLDPDRRVRAARRANGQLPVFLTVKVEQNRPTQKARVEPARTLARATDLLVERHQQLQRSVRLQLVLGQRHHRRDADAVVRAERRPVGG
jgi:hypothetical protein